VFILYAIVIGVVAGYLAGGRFERLGSLPFRFAPVIFAALAVQLLIFGPLVDVVGGAGPPLYLGSTVAALLAVAANIRIPGLILVVAGTASNLAAILANGGVMPADPGALLAAGLDPQGGFSNSAVLDDPALRPLTDIFAIPAAVPFANVFSVGDVLIAAGVAIAIAWAMRDGGPVRRGTSYD
jgi:Family of unknown function (DUF5317)